MNSLKIHFKFKITIIMQALNYSQNLCDYIISLDKSSEYLLCCTLNFNGNIWVSVILQDDLKSQMVDLKRLRNIIKLNSNQIMSNYSICLRLVEQIKLILNIIVILSNGLNKLHFSNTHQNLQCYR